MKWKHYKESVNDAADFLNEVEEPVRNVQLDEIYPGYDGGIGSGLDSNAQFLIDEYIGDQAKKWYTNRHIPDDEEQEMRDSLVAVYAEFEYWAPEDEDYEEGYDRGQMMFIIDKDDGSLCNVDFYETDYSDEVYEIVKAKAYAKVGVKPGSNLCPN